MRDLQPDARPLGGVHGLADGLHRADVLVPRVGRVQPIAAGHDPAQPLDLIGRCDALDRVLEAGREAGGALVERLAEERARWSAVRRPSPIPGVGHGGQPEGSMRHERSHVDRWPSRVHRVEIAAERPPVDDRGGIVAVDVVGMAGRGIDRRAAVTTVADELGGDTLGDGALGRRVDDDGQVGVAVDVDEARGDDAATRVHPARRLDHAEIGVYGRDPIAPDGHIGTDPRGARPVDQRAAVEDDIGALAEAARERLGASLDA